MVLGTPGTPELQSEVFFEEKVMVLGRQTYAGEARTDVEEEAVLLVCRLSLHLRRSQLRRPHCRLQGRSTNPYCVPPT